MIGNAVAPGERQIIRANTEVLGGVLLSRTQIVVDCAENPGPYEHVYGQIDELLKVEASTPETELAKAVDFYARRAVPQWTLIYEHILKTEATAIGIDRLDHRNQLGLSRFIFNGGICHQHALLSAAMLRIFQIRRGVPGKLSIESTRPNEYDPDRHVRVRFTTDKEDLLIDSVGGVRRVNGHRPV